MPSTTRIPPHQHPHLTSAWTPRLAVLAVAALVAGCQGDRALAPPTGGAQLDERGGEHLEGTIAFHSSRTGNFEIFLMNADGRGQTQLTSDARLEFDPVLSPNGASILFTGVDESSFGVYVMRSDGTGMTELARSAYGPTWSPNGRQIAMVAFRDDHAGIYLMDADDPAGMHLLLVDDAIGSVTGWSPDGKRLAFVSYRDGHDGEFWIADVATGAQTQLTDNEVNDEGDHATWSQNGKLFLFSRFRYPPNWDIGDPGGDLDIWVMNADGTGQRQLTNDPTHDDDPFWSPDNRHIAFQSSRDGDEEVYVMDADGGNVRQVTFNEDFFDAVPTWTSRMFRR